MIIASLALALAQAAPPAPAKSSKLLSRVDASRLIAACMIKRDRRHASLFVENEPHTPAFKKAWSELESAMAACIMPESQSLTLRINDLRGTLAEALLREAGGAALDRAGALSAEPPQRIGVGKSGIANDDRLFRCAIAASPIAAAALVKADPASPAEAAAFNDLGAALQQCVPENVEMKLQLFQIRWLVAAALYSRLAASQREVPIVEAAE